MASVTIQLKASVGTPKAYFCFVAAILWNDIHPEIQVASTLMTFHMTLKLFSQILALGNWSSLLVCYIRFGVAGQIYHLVLLF